MSTPIIAQKSPYPVQVEAGRTYAWCACGGSKSQPLCDGSHKGTGFAPKLFKAEKTETLWFCGCKHTKGAPLCDGTHKGLGERSQKTEVRRQKTGDRRGGGWRRWTEDGRLERGGRETG